MFVNIPVTSESGTVIIKHFRELIFGNQQFGVNQAPQVEFKNTACVNNEWCQKFSMRKIIRATYFFYENSL